MENTEILYFTLGAVSLMVGMLAYNPVKQLWYVIKSSISPRKNTQIIGTDPLILSKLEDLQTQVDNLAEVVSRRDKNRKHNTRRDVREYLAELQTK